MALWRVWVHFYVLLDTKWVISERFFPVNVLDTTGETKRNTTKQNIHLKHSTRTQNKQKKLKLGLIASYNFQSGNEAGILLTQKPTWGGSSIPCGFLSGTQ